MKFVNHQSVGGPPVSGYKPRSHRAALAKLEPFVRKLHTERFTIDEIVLILESLPENSCHPSRAQLFSEMQTWGLTGNGRRRKPNLAASSRVPREISVLPNMKPTDEQSSRPFSWWELHFFENVYLLTVPQILREDEIDYLRLRGKSIMTCRDLLVERKLCTSMMPIVLGLTLQTMLLDDRDDSIVLLDGYKCIKDSFVRPNRELERLCNFVYEYLKTWVDSCRTIPDDGSTASSPTKDTTSFLAEAIFKTNIDTGMFLFMDVMSRSGLEWSQAHDTRQAFDSRPIRERMFSQLAAFPTTFIMWMAGGIEKYSYRTAACVLSLLLLRIMDISDDRNCEELSNGLEKDVSQDQHQE